jgi:hypothetical protein
MWRNIWGFGIVLWWKGPGRIAEVKIMVVLIGFGGEIIAK